MNNLENILIPLVAISAVFSVPIIAIVYHFRQKGKEMEERKLMIEKGITPPPLEDGKRKNKSRKALEDGFYLVAIGLGFFVGLWIEDTFDISKGFALGGATLLFLGIANLLIVLFTEKEKKDER